MGGWKKGEYMMKSTRLFWQWITFSPTGGFHRETTQMGCPWSRPRVSLSIYLNLYLCSVGVSECRSVRRVRRVGVSEC